MKVIFTVRDPRDMCVGLWWFATNYLIVDKKKYTWPAHVDMYCRGDRWTGSLGSWLSDTLQWWKLHQAHPDQVCWVVFEEMVQEPQKTVREAAAFLDVPVDDATVVHLAEAMAFSEVMRRFGKDLGPILREGKVGSHKSFELFSPEDNERFQAELIRPALEAGVRLAPEVWK